MAKKRYKVGAIGTAWAAKSPLPTFASYPDVELYAICSARLERAKAAAEQFGAPLAFDDYRQMVALPEIDIVYIGAPVYLHHPMTVAAAEAGKHILCEKPAAVNAEQAREMLEAAERNNVAHISAFTMRFFPHTMHIKRLVEEGFIGEVRQITVEQWAGWPAGTPPRPWTWLNDAALGGGFLGAMGSHYIDLVRYWFGEWATATGQLRTWNPDCLDEHGGLKKATADDAVALLGTLENGAVVSIQLGFGNRAGTGFQLEIYGSNGSIVVDNDLKLRVAGPTDRALQPIDTPEPEFPEAAARSAVPRFGLLVHKLIDAIEQGTDQHPNLVDSLRCQEVIDAVHRGQASGLPPIAQALPTR